MGYFNNYYVFIKSEYTKSFFINYKIAFNLNITPIKKLSYSKDINTIV